jgi:hypothetical protein
LHLEPSRSRAAGSGRWTFSGWRVAESRRRCIALPAGAGGDGLMAPGKLTPPLLESHTRRLFHHGILLKVM